MHDELSIHNMRVIAKMASKGKQLKNVDMHLA